MRQQPLIDIGDIVDTTATRLKERSTADAWTACASVWARLWVHVGPAWSRWPDARDHVLEALSLALCRAAAAPTTTSSTELALIQLEGIDVEDDGSPECQFVVDLVAALSDVLRGEPVEQCVRTSLAAFLEGAFNALANDLAKSSGRSISQAEASMRLRQDETWMRAVKFVRSL
jgi:hypothetical protein